MTQSESIGVASSVQMVIPLPLNLANSRLHWAEKMRKKRAYWDELTIRKQAKIIPPPPVRWPTFARVEMVLYVARLMDKGNAYNRVKWVEDWLAGHGYIAGDREDQIDLQVSQKVDRKNTRIHVVITPIECVEKEAS